MHDQQRPPRTNSVVVLDWSMWTGMTALLSSVANRGNVDFDELKVYGVLMK
jgi:hypothetical protein